MVRSSKQSSKNSNEQAISDSEEHKFMSFPMMLTLEPEHLDTPEKRLKHLVSVIGCGRTGIMQAMLFLDAGFKVTCIDSDQTTVNQILRGKVSFLEPGTTAKMRDHVKKGKLTATNEIENAVYQSDIIAVTIPVRINLRKNTEYSDLEKTCKKIGSNIHGGALVIVTSLTGIGITEGLIKETLENTSGLKAGTDFGLAYSPLQTMYAATWKTVTGHQRMVAAGDKLSLNAAALVLETISKAAIIRIANVKTAETTALFEVLQRDVGVALANELALFCEKARVDIMETKVTYGANTDNFPLAYRLADENLSDEPYILLTDEENLNAKSRLATAARDTNEETVKHVVNMTKDALNECGKTLKRAKITLLGVSETPNAHGLIKRTAKAIIENLEARGVKMSVYDPYLSDDESAETLHGFKKNMNEAIERADCIIILTAHDEFKHINLKKMKLSVKMPAAIIDLEGVAEPDKIEKESLVYRGIGRGIWK